MFYDSGGVSSSRQSRTCYATPGHITLTSALITATLSSYHTNNFVPFFFTSIMGADYYKLLGVSSDASDEDIKKAYKKMVRPLLLLISHF